MDLTGEVYVDYSPYENAQPQPQQQQQGSGGAADFSQSSSLPQSDDREASKGHVPSQQNNNKNNDNNINDQQQQQQAAQGSGDPSLPRVSELLAKIRQEIFNELGITASAGVAHNVLLARMATKKGKPNGE